MNQKNKQSHGSGASHHHEASHNKKPQRRMVIVVGAVLALLAIFGYVMTMDESIVPPDEMSQPIPVDAPTE